MSSVRYDEIAVQITKEEQSNNEPFTTDSVYLDPVCDDADDEIVETETQISAVKQTIQHKIRNILRQGLRMSIHT
jgi:hypothetical protein